MIPRKLEAEGKGKEGKGEQGRKRDEHSENNGNDSKSPKTKEIQKLSITKLKSRLNDCHESMTNMRFQKVLGDLEYPQKIKTIKKEIAQIKTAIREFELGKRGN